jgi:hypothetical protein
MPLTSISTEFLKYRTEKKAKLNAKYAYRVYKTRSSCMISSDSSSNKYRGPIPCNFLPLSTTISILFLYS